MTLYEENEKQLLIELEAIDFLLNVGTVSWEEVRGVLNMLKNRNRDHYVKIRHKLFLDFRMVEDHRISIEGLGGRMGRAYKLADFFEKNES